MTRLFKCGNHCMFGEDLEHRIADLEYSIGTSVCVCVSVCVSVCVCVCTVEPLTMGHSK